MASHEHLLVERNGAVATVTINRPDKLNALNAAVISELTAAYRKLDDGATRAAVLTGAGDRAFVAGADIAQMSEMTPAEAKAFSDSGHAACTLIERVRFPTIAAVHGFALGGGCELALASDFIYASEKAKFGQPEVNLGLMPGFGGTQRLARRVGLGLARELVYSGDPIGARRALEVGLVNAIYAQNELLAKATATAEKIAQKAPLAIRASKRVMERGFDADLAAANELEAQAFSALFGSRDQREGTKAFLEKRKPEFQGR